MAFRSHVTPTEMQHKYEGTIISEIPCNWQVLPGLRHVTNAAKSAGCEASLIVNKKGKILKRSCNEIS